jgi:hypothetical protein
LVFRSVISISLYYIMCLKRNFETVVSVIVWRQALKELSVLLNFSYVYWNFKVTFKLFKVCLCFTTKRNVLQKSIQSGSDGEHCTSFRASVSTCLYKKIKKPNFFVLEVCIHIKYIVDLELMEFNQTTEWLLPNPKDRDIELYWSCSCLLIITTG